MKTRIAENLARSAKAPTISPQVIAAKAPWKMTKVNSEIYTPLLKVAPSESIVTPFRNSLESTPKKLPPSVKTSE